MEIIIYDAEGRAIRVSKACVRCCTNEQKGNGEVWCQECLDTLVYIGVKPKPELEREQLRCNNSDKGVTGCVYWAQPGKSYCSYCAKLIKDAVTPGPRIRTVPEAARPCTLTEACEGQMKATVRLGPAVPRPVLYWHCVKCSRTEIAKWTGAMHDPHIAAAVVEAAKQKEVDTKLADSLDSYSSEAASMADHIRDILTET